MPYVSMNDMCDESSCMDEGCNHILKQIDDMVFCKNCGKRWYEEIDEDSCPPCPPVICPPCNCPSYPNPWDTWISTGTGDKITYTAHT